MWSARVFLPLAIPLLFLLSVAANPTSADDAPGLIFEGYEVDEKLSRVRRPAPGELPNVARIVPRVEFAGGSDNFPPLTDQFVTRVYGYLKIPRGGSYGLRIRSDDGALVFVDDELRIDHDGMHGATPQACDLELRAGRHTLLIEHFDGGGADALTLDWKPPGTEEWVVIPDKYFAHPKSYEPRTSPGKKKLEPPSPTHGLTRDDAVGRAIDLGVEYLLKQIRREPVVEPNTKTPSGQVPFETYALLVSGVSVDDPLIVQNFRFLERVAFAKKKNTYTISLAILCHDAAIAQLEQDELLVSPGQDSRRVINNPKIGRNHYQEIARLTSLLLANQNPSGGWNYQLKQGGGDISCTQFAVLALGLAVKRGVKVPLEAWLESARFTIALQKAKGPLTKRRLTLVPESERHQGGAVDLARHYEPRRRKKPGGGTSVPKEPRDPTAELSGVEVRARSYKYDAADFGPIVNAVWNRTCAAVSSLILVSDICGEAYPADKRAELRTAIRDGYGYLLENWRPYESYYGIYSLEKLGDLGHVQRFGDIDWFDQASQWLLDAQTQQGNWPKTAMWGEKPRVSTAFALLVLTRATNLMTRDPSQAVIFTGSSRAQAEADPNWVYLPDHDTSISFSELTRALRYRPRRKLLRFYLEVLGNYPREHRPALVPRLLEIRNKVSGRGPKKALADALELVTDRDDLSEDDELIEWHARWVRIEQAGLTGDRTVIPELVATYRDRKTASVLKWSIVRAATRLQARELAPPLLDELESDRRAVRSAAHQGLVGIFGTDLPSFHVDGAESKRRKQIETIREWVSSH